MERDYFVIDLDKSHEILIFNHADVLSDLETFDLKDPLDLGDYDRKIFKNENEAERYLEKYLKVYNSLPKMNLVSIPKIPKMLYKRRYLVQTILGEKMQTYRHYNKGWSNGQLFQLHDQTYFLTVQLTSIEQTDQDEYCYKFTLANNR